MPLAIRVVSLCFLRLSVSPHDKRHTTILTQAIFNKHDPKGRGFLSQAQLRHLLKGVGLNVENKDLKLLFGRIDHDATNSVSRYLAHADLELDPPITLDAPVLFFPREFQVLKFSIILLSLGCFSEKCLRVRCPRYNSHFSSYVCGWSALPLLGFTIIWWHLCVCRALRALNV